MPGPTARLLGLLSLLQTPRTWSGSELAARLEVTRRTVRRDVERLRDLGYPVEADLGTQGGYRLVAGAAMPPLLLEDDEAVAVALGLRAMASYGLPGLEDAGLRALGKLTRSLPWRLRRRVETFRMATVGWIRPTHEADPEVLAVLASAASNSERLRMGYQDSHGHSTRRHVEPQRLVHQHQRWYLLAYDLERDAWRHFRADRIDSPTSTGTRSAHRLADDEVQDLLRDATMAIAPVYRADVSLELSTAEAGARLRDHLGDGTLTEDGDRTRWHSAPDTVEWLTVRLILLDCDFTVEGPPALLEHLQTIHRRSAPQLRGAYDQH